MKFIVDEMPKSKSECLFSEWKPYPPIMEETGHYICKINQNDCNLCETECKLLKQKAVAPKKENDGNPEPCTSWWYVCGDCGRYIDPHDKFCRHCGREVDWLKEEQHGQD